MLDERKEFLDQAKIVLAYVEENADLTPEYLEWLVAMSEKTLEVFFPCKAVYPYFTRRIGGKSYLKQNGGRQPDI